MTERRPPAAAGGRRRSPRVELVDEGVGLLDHGGPRCGRSLSLGRTTTDEVDRIEGAGQCLYRTEGTAMHCGRARRGALPPYAESRRAGSFAWTTAVRPLRPSRASAAVRPLCGQSDRQPPRGPRDCSWVRAISSVLGPWSSRVDQAPARTRARAARAGRRRRGRVAAGARREAVAELTSARRTTCPGVIAARSASPMGTGEPRLKPFPRR